MRYSRVFIDAIAYELPPLVITSEELEAFLAPVYRTLHIPMGQLEIITGITERRWWEPGFSVAEGAAQAGRKALDRVGLSARDLDVLIYGGVCREQFEPATACHAAAALGVNGDAAVYDVSNACLGVLNGMVEIANRIELGQARAGLVVSCESAREINEATIRKLIEKPSMDLVRTSLATLTGGSGAAAVLLTDGSFDTPARTQLLGGVSQTAPQFYNLCRWGFEEVLPHTLRHFLTTDSVGILKHGVALGLKTWSAFLNKVGWVREQIDKVICHQVGATHRSTILNMLGIPEDRDFSTFPYLGNMGTVSLPLTAALADEREFLQPGDRVGLLGIASGLNCLMLGVKW
jgi:3-oxoacyl-[acyl-carrier-protein] synthase-3